MRNLGLGILFVGRDQFTGTARRVRDTLGSVSEQAKVAKADFAALGVVSGKVAQTIVGFGVSAGEFQRDLAKVANVSGATGDEMKQLRDAAVQAGIETQFSPSEAVRGLESLASAGYNARDSMDLLRPSLLLAAAGGISVGKASGTMSTILKGFSLEVADAGRVTDILANAAAKAKVQIIELESGIGKTIRGASLANQSFDEMVVGLGLAKNTMINASSAGNSISRALTSLGVKSDFIKSKIGVNVLDSQGKFKDWLDLVVEIGDAADKTFTNAADRTEFFNKAIGTFGLESFQTTLNQIRDTAGAEGLLPKEAIALIRSQFLDAEGTAQAFADRVNSTFAGMLNMLKGTLETFAIVIGEPIAEFLQPLVGALTNALNFLLRAFEDLPRPVKLVVGGALAIAAALAAALSAGVALKLGMTLLGPAFTAVATKMAATAIAAAPLILTVGAVAAAIGLLVVGIRSNFAGLGDLWDSTFGRAKLVVQGLAQIFSSGMLSGAVLDELNRVENSGLKRFVITLAQVGYRVKRFFQGVLVGLEETLGPPVRSLWRAVSRLGSAMGRVFGAVLSIFTRLGQALGLVSRKGAEAAAKAPSSSFFETGAKLARIFGTVLGFTLDLLVKVIDTVAWGVEKIASGIEYVSAAVGAFGSLLSRIFEPIVAQVSTVRDVFSAIVDEIRGLISEVVGLANDAIEVAEKVAKYTDPRQLTRGIDIGSYLPEGIESVEQLEMLVQQRREGAVSSASGEAERTRVADDTSSTRDSMDVVRAMQRLADRPLKVQVQVPSGETLFETLTRGAAQSRARSFDVSDQPLG